jgi:hypothetical protein
MVKLLSRAKRDFFLDGAYTVRRPVSLSPPFIVSIFTRVG